MKDERSTKHGTGNPRENVLVTTVGKNQKESRHSQTPSGRCFHRAGSLVSSKLVFSFLFLFNPPGGSWLVDISLTSLISLRGMNRER